MDHNCINYGYGSEHLNSFDELGAMAAGTSLGITTTQQQTVIDHMLDGSQWMVRGETYDLTAMGRGVSRKGYSTSANVLLGQLSDVMTSALIEPVNYKPFKPVNRHPTPTMQRIFRKD